MVLQSPSSSRSRKSLKSQGEAGASAKPSSHRSNISSRKAKKTIKEDDKCDDDGFN